MDIERLVKEFNRKNGTRVQWSGGSVRYMFETVKDFDESVIEEIILNCKSDTLQNILNPQFIKSYLKEKELQAQIERLTKKQEELEKKKEEEEQTTVTLGLVEKALAKVMVEEYAPTLADAVKNDIDKYIRDTYGKLEKPIVFTLPQTGGSTDGEITHEQFETVLKFVMADEPVMLVGPAGTGKNVICKQVAKVMNLPFYFTNAVTQEYKLTGFIDANGHFHETEFYKAFKNGGIFMLDEIDASIPEVLIILNAAIANRYFDFPNGKIEAHPNFRVIAAGNTFGTGASYTYVGRNQLDGASLDRFALIHVGYSERIENSLTNDTNLLRFVRDFRRVCERNSINHIVSYRAITRMSKMKQVMPIKEVLKSCLVKNLEKDDIRMITSKLRGNSEWERGLQECAE